MIKLFNFTNFSSKVLQNQLTYGRDRIYYFLGFRFRRTHLYVHGRSGYIQSLCRLFPRRQAASGIYISPGGNRKDCFAMSFSYLKKLPTPAEIREQYPLSERGKEIKRRKDQALRDIFTGKSDKFLVVIGPCSADNEDAVCDYISRLSRVSEKVKDRIEIVPRIYTYKPRTNGDGYKGIAFQPNPEERPDLVAGLIAIRRLQMRSIEEFGLPAADEMLYPENWGYVEDLLSYVAIGARSVEDQHHRQTASGFDVPTGMKNPTSGDFSVMLNSIYAAQHPQL